MEKSSGNWLIAWIATQLCHGLLLKLPLEMPVRRREGALLVLNGARDGSLDLLPGCQVGVAESAPSASAANASP